MPATPSSISDIEPVRRLAAGHSRPRAVFAGDDTLGADKGLAERARILIVEDDFIIAWEIEASLAKAGFEVTGVASSGQEALELVEAQRPVLVLMDIRLRGKHDGIDVALELFKMHGIRCIFATAHADKTARARARPANPLGWLPKPYTMMSLVAAVTRAVLELRDGTE